MKIYLSNTTDFNNNGLGFLTDCLTAIVTETLNGDYTLEFTYPVNGRLSEYLEEGNIVKCNVGNDSYQLFRIKTVTKTFTTITILAYHIFYDLLDNLLLDVAPTNQNCTSFGEWILSRTNFTNSFTFYSDIDTTKSARYVRKNPVEAILGTQDNSMVNLFGGDLVRDNFSIKLLANRGSSTAKKLIVGKNITDIQVSIDVSSLATRILPLGYDGLMLPEKYVDSSLINSYPTPKISVVEFSNIQLDTTGETEGAYTTEDEFYQALRNAVNNLYLNGIDKPSITLKVNWLELSKTEQYKYDYKVLETINLGDTITANVLGLDYTTRVTKTKYNVLSDMIETFEIGTMTKTIANTINSQNATINDIKPTSILASAKTSATNLINNAMGGYVYKTNSELYIMDTDNPETALKVWRWNINGLGYSSNGINGTYQTAMTMDGSIVADMITTGKINTSLIEGYDSLVTRVEKVVNLTTESYGTSKVSLSNLLKTRIVSLRIHPTDTDFIGVRPNSSLLASTSVKVNSLQVLFKNSDDDSLHYNLPCDLLQLNDTYDEYYQNNKTGECYVIHRIGYDSNGNKVILDTPTKETFDGGWIIVEGDCDITMPYNTNAYIYAIAMIKNDYTETFATTYEVASTINQTASDLELKVNEKVNEDEVIASLNVAVKNHQGIVHLQGNAVTIDSDNFSLDKDGTINCTNANVSGTINTTEGNLGGWNIKSTGLNNGTVFIHSNGYSNNYTFADFVIVRNYLLGKITFDEGEIKHYDFNGDGSVTIQDLLHLQKMILEADL